MVDARIEGMKYEFSEFKTTMNEIDALQLRINSLHASK